MGRLHRTAYQGWVGFYLDDRGRHGAQVGASPVYDFRAPDLAVAEHVLWAKWEAAGKPVEPSLPEGVKLLAYPNLTPR